MEVLCRLFVYAEPIEPFQVLRKVDLVGTMWDDGDTVWDDGNTSWDKI